MTDLSDAALRKMAAFACGQLHQCPGERTKQEVIFDALRTIRNAQRERDAAIIEQRKGDHVIHSSGCWCIALLQLAAAIRRGA